VTTPTEASAIGASGALLCAALKKRLTWKVFRDASLDAFKLSAMVGWIVLGAKAFSHIYAAVGAGHFIDGLVQSVVDRRGGPHVQVAADDDLNRGDARSNRLAAHRCPSPFGSPSPAWARLPGRYGEVSAVL
jgi:hypothetical protein